MSSSAGRRSAAYVRARNLFKTGVYECWLNYPGCTRIGNTVDHDPPLTAFAHVDAWHGRYMPACQPCQSKQGQAIAARRTRAKQRWTNPQYT